MHRRNVAPTDDALVIKHDELREVMRQQVAVESEGLLKRRSLCEGQIFQLARHHVDYLVQCVEVTLGSVGQNVGQDKRCLDSDLYAKQVGCESAKGVCAPCDGSNVAHDDREVGRCAQRKDVAHPIRLRFRAQRLNRYMLENLDRTRLIRLGLCDSQTLRFECQGRNHHRW